MLIEDNVDATEILSSISKTKCGARTPDPALSDSENDMKVD